MKRRALVHFLDADTRAPLCAGSGSEAGKAAVNGVAVCALCARLVTALADRGVELARPAEVRH